MPKKDARRCRWAMYRRLYRSGLPDLFALPNRKVE